MGDVSTCFMTIDVDWNPCILDGEFALSGNEESLTCWNMIAEATLILLGIFEWVLLWLLMRLHNRRSYCAWLIRKSSSLFILPHTTSMESKFYATKFMLLYWIDEIEIWNGKMLLGLSLTHWLSMLCYIWRPWTQGESKTTNWVQKDKSPSYFRC